MLRSKPNHSTFLRLTCLLLTSCALTGLVLAQTNLMTVQSGDSLWSIARRYGIQVATLKRLNNLKSERLQFGQTLRLATITSSPGRVIRASSFQERVLYPLRGVITTRYGARGLNGKAHSGLDIAAPWGTPVLAALSGTVIRAGWDRFGYGNLVVIRGVDQHEYWYAHNSSLAVRVGQKVQQGQMISRVGSTGFSSGAHLHFEIRSSGSVVLNPSAFLPRSTVMVASFRGR